MKRFIWIDFKHTHATITQATIFFLERSAGVDDGAATLKQKNRPLGAAREETSRGWTSESPNHVKRHLVIFSRLQNPEHEGPNLVFYLGDISAGRWC